MSGNGDAASRNQEQSALRSNVSRPPLIRYEDEDNWVYYLDNMVVYGKGVVYMSAPP